MRRSYTLRSNTFKKQLSYDLEIEKTLKKNKSRKKRQWNYQTYKNQGYRLHPSISQEQEGSSNAIPRQNLYEKTSKLEETLTQFMKVSLSNHRSIEASIRSLEFQVVQLANQLAERNSKNFLANTEENLKSSKIERDP